ncbi:hypothetical protein [Falsiroseomonas sp.]|uniref:hypothetical protein n=1 Tax=Falsiroseomonas sp. TaxID=2870721 RepID=UPI002716E3BA|nr:hypothetical protein [Falsiroseomonas sp.]MDO9502158.1 hypothetical protein [Falsiroseomonas sp.]
MKTEKQIARLVVVKPDRPFPHDAFSAILRPRRLVAVADDYTRSVGPAHFDSAADLVRWARAVIVTTRIGDDDDHRLVLAHARQSSRVLLVMTRGAQAEAWSAYARRGFPRKRVIIRTGTTAAPSPLHLAADRPTPGHRDPSAPQP